MRSELVQPRLALALAYSKYLGTYGVRRGVRTAKRNALLLRQRAPAMSSPGGYAKLSALDEDEDMDEGEFHCRTRGGVVSF